MHSHPPAIATRVRSDAAPATARVVGRRVASPFTRTEGAPRAGMLHGEVRVSSATALVDSLFHAGATQAPHFFT